MIFVLERTSAPDIEPVTLAEMLVHLREFSSISEAKQSQVTGLIKGAREWVEDFSGRALVDQGWKLSEYLDNNRFSSDVVAGLSSGCFFGQYVRTRNEVRLRRSPILEVTRVATIDTLGEEVEVDPGTYEVRDTNSKWPVLIPKTGSVWTASSLRIEFRAGFVDRLGSPQQEVELIPERFKQAMKLWVEANYDRDDKTMDKLLAAAESLIKPERSEFGMA